MKTAAFITSQSAKIGPWEVNDGLPTLESCRDLPLALQGKLLFASGLIDTVIIGNAYASDAELKALAAIDRYKLTFGVSVEAEASEIERRILAETNHFRRGDSNALVARSTITGEIPSHRKPPSYKPRTVCLWGHRYRQ